MGAFTTLPLTTEQYKMIIKTMRTGSSFFKKNDRYADALIFEANLGIRIEDVFMLTPNAFQMIGDELHIQIVEHKTKHKRDWPINDDFASEILKYIRERNFDKDDFIFMEGSMKHFKNKVEAAEYDKQLLKRIKSVESCLCKYLAKVAYYLEYEQIGTHSFRKYAGRQLYEATEHDIEVVREFYGHDSIKTTQRYIMVVPDRLKGYIKGIHHEGGVLS